MPNWAPIFVLPNLNLHAEMCVGWICLAGAETEIVEKTKAASSQFRKLHDNFTTEFRKKVEPSVIFADLDVRERPDISEIVAFRDVVSISVLAKSYSSRFKYRADHRVFFSDTFKFYPWQLSKDEKVLLCNTPAQLGIHRVKNFSGHSYPETPVGQLGSKDIDAVVYDGLTGAWLDTFDLNLKSKLNNSLFRSLNMAYSASLVPANISPLHYDYGRQLALWVSAIEILIHPVFNRASLGNVIEMIENGVSVSKKFARRKYSVCIGKKTKRVRLPSKQYATIYSLRNNYLHGEPVKSRDLLLPCGTGTILDICPLLYRLMLTYRLGLNWTQQVPDHQETEKFAKHIVEKMRFEDYQGEVEDALRIAWTKI